MQAWNPGTWAESGDLGGFVESENNLSQDGDCWIYDEASAVGQSVVKDNAMLRDEAFIQDNAIVSGEAIVQDSSSLYGNSCVKDNAVVHGRSSLSGRAIVKDDAVAGNVVMKDDSIIDENASADTVHVEGHGKITGTSMVMGSFDDNSYDCYITVKDHGIIANDADVAGTRLMVAGNAMVLGKVCKDMDLTGEALIRDDDDYLSFEDMGCDGYACHCMGDKVKIYHSDSMDEPMLLDDFHKLIVQTPDKDWDLPLKRDVYKSIVDAAEDHFGIDFSDKDLDFGKTESMEQ